MLFVHIKFFNYKEEENFISKTDYICLLEAYSLNGFLVYTDSEWEIKL